MALVARLLPLGWRIVITAPQVNILGNFRNAGENPWTHVKYGSQVLDITGKPLVKEKLDARDIGRYLKAGEGYALSMTQQALVAFTGKNELSDLDRCLLIIDEFHHAAADGFGAVVAEWRSRGGLVAGYTATPWRTDGRDVGWLDDNMASYYLSLAEHMQSGHCPSTLHSEFVGYEAAEVTDDNFSGITLTKREAEAIADAVYSKWVNDKKPKFVLYYQSSTIQRNRSVREAVIRKFKKAGERLLDSTGEEGGERFNTELEAERQRTCKESKYAGIVGCGRVREGMDWPHCSAVYVIGMPTSTNLLVQLFGRACRKKGDDYKPAAYRVIAEISFFLPSTDGSSFEHISQAHSWNTLAVCFFLTDSSLGQRSIAMRKIGAGVRKVVKDTALEAEVNEEVMKLALEQDATYAGKSVENEVMAQVLDLADQGMHLDEIADVLCDRGYESGVVNAALVQQGIIERPETAEQVERDARRLARAATKISVPKIAKEVFAAYVQEFRSLTLKGSAYSKGVAKQLHQVGGVKALVESLRGREFASVEEVREFTHDLTVTRYQEVRLKKSEEAGKLYPHSGEFFRCYGVTFHELKAGWSRGGEVAPLDEVREFIRDMTVGAYKEARFEKSREMGYNFPQPSAFPEHYGMTFRELKTGIQGVATLEEVREFIQSMEGREYREARLEVSRKMGKKYPDLGLFPKYYGMTFQEVRTGRRQGGGMASLDEVRDFIQDMEASEYNQARREQATKSGKLYPSSNFFPKCYGMTFREVKTGVRKGGEVVPVEKIRPLIQGLTPSQYDAVRLEWSEKTGKLHPLATSFYKYYGMSFMEVKTGRGLGGQVATLEDVRAFIQNMTVTEYNEARSEKNRKSAALFPNASEFLRCYGMTFREVKTGSRNGEVAPVKEVRRFIRGMTSGEYQKARLKTGKSYPHVGLFPKYYGMTFAELRDGSKAAE